MAGRERYTFGELTLDVAERRLLRSGRSVSLPPRAYDLLVHLVRHAGHLVSKQELLDGVWSRAFVEEGILSVHVSALRKALGDDNKSPRYIETVSRSGYRFIAPVVSSALHSIAVLPVLSVGHAPPDSGRAIGLALAAELIDRLGRYREITVRPTRAIQHLWAAEGMDVTAAGSALQVDGVIRSEFEIAADRVQVAAELWRVDDETRIWSGAYAESRNGPMAIADTIAEAIAGYLGLAPSEERSPGVFGHWMDPPRSSAVRPPARPEVYELTGRGRSHLLAFSRAQVPDAITAYEAAIALDSAFAPAHAGLALALCMQAEFRLAPPADAYDQARRAALRALALHDACADAQVALGAVSFLGHWDWVGTERSLRRALEINPNHTEAYVLYGRLLDALGRLEEGLAMKMHALERDPFSPLVHLAISMSYWNQHRFDESTLWARKTLDLDPRHLMAREMIAGGFWAVGDFDRHMAENIAHAETHGAPAETIAHIKHIYANEGRAAVVRWTIDTQGPHLPSFQLALLHSELGNFDDAIGHLERAIDSHEPCLVELAVAPQWDRLRADPRFGHCLERVGLR